MTFLFATFLTNFIKTVLKLATNRKHFMKDNVQIANEHRRWLSTLLVTRKANDDFRERPLLHTVQWLLRNPFRPCNDEDLQNLLKKCDSTSRLKYGNNPCSVHVFLLDTHQYKLAHRFARKEIHDFLARQFIRANSQNDYHEDVYKMTDMVTQ